MLTTWRPQIITAMGIIGILAVMVIIFIPALADKTVTAAITAVGMLGMKLLEKE